MNILQEKMYLVLRVRGYELFKPYGLDKSLNIKLNVRHFIIEYGGPHGWFDTTTMENTFIWLKLNFMNAVFLPRDTAFVNVVFKLSAGNRFAYCNCRLAACLSHRKKSTAFFSSNNKYRMVLRQTNIYRKANRIYKKIKKETEQILEEEKRLQKIITRVIFFRKTPRGGRQNLNDWKKKVAMPEFWNQRLAGFIWHSVTIPLLML